jgi:multiple sugar transport system substrate-binding protein
MAFCLSILLMLFFTACGKKSTTSTPMETPTIACGSPTATPSGPTKIHWYIGLGEGTSPEQINKQLDFIDKFNEENGTKYVLIAEMYPNAVAYDALRSKILSEDSPDLVGPVGIEGLYRMQGAWVDLTKMIASNNYSLTDFKTTLVDVYKLGTQGQVALPFGVYPSVLWYNKTLFDQAKQPYPPHKFGDPYGDKTWDYATLRELAMKLTTDINGYDATSVDFDPNLPRKTYGFYAAQADLRTQGSYLASGNVIASDNTTAQLSDNWRRVAHWYYDGMWKDLFIPIRVIYKSETFGSGDPFRKGNLAMMPQNFSYLPSLASVTDISWDVAAIPSFEGNAPVSPLKAISFAIPKASKNQQAAFEVMSLFLDKYAQELLDIYGALPARISLKDAALKALKEKYPNIDAVVFFDALEYIDIPSHEVGLPNFQKSLDALAEFQTDYETKSDLDLDKRLDDMISTLQDLFNEIYPLE